jgi:hypothetical protein
MRKTLGPALLILALCRPVSAGIIHNPAPQPTTTTKSAVQEPTNDPTLNGEMPDPGEIQTSGVPESLTEVVLDLLSVLPSLL